MRPTKKHTYTSAPQPGKPHQTTPKTGRHHLTYTTETPHIHPLYPANPRNQPGKAENSPENLANSTESPTFAIA